MNYAKLWNATIVCIIVAAITLLLGHGLRPATCALEDRIVAKRGPTGRIVVVHQLPYHVQH